MNLLKLYRIYLLKSQIRQSLSAKRVVKNAKIHKISYLEKLVLWTMLVNLKEKSNLIIHKSGASRDEIIWVRTKHKIVQIHPRPSR